MDYLTAWREGHEAGMQLALKIINELTGHDFQKSSEVVLYIKQLEGDPSFDITRFDEPEFEEQPIADEGISKKEHQLMDVMANKIAMKNWLWS